MNWETLLCIGDSITIGSRTYLGYPEVACDLLRQRLERQWVSLNFSVSGLKVNEIQRNLGFEIEKFKAMSPGLITILAGTNDTRDKTPPAFFEIAYRQLLIKTMLIRPADQILLFQIPELQKGVKSPYFISSNPLVGEYNVIIDRLAREYSIQTIRLKVDPQDFCDGVHLNDTGIFKMGRLLAGYVLSIRGMSLSDKPESVMVDSIA